MNDYDGDYLELLLFKTELEDGDIVIRESDSLGSFILPYRGTNKSGGILTEFYFDYIAGILQILLKEVVEKQKNID